MTLASISPVTMKMARSNRGQYLATKRVSFNEGMNKLWYTYPSGVYDRSYGENPEVASKSAAVADTRCRQFGTM